MMFASEVCGYKSGGNSANLLEFDRRELGDFGAEGEKKWREGAGGVWVSLLCHFSTTPTTSTQPPPPSPEGQGQRFAFQVFERKKGYCAGGRKPKKDSAKLSNGGAGTQRPEGGADTDGRRCPFPFSGSEQAEAEDPLSGGPH